MLDAGNPFFTDVAQGIELAAETADLSLFLCNSDNRAAREDTHLAHLQQQRVQGILITPVDPEAPALDAIARHGTPVVIVDRIRQDESFCSVAVDDVLGGRLAVAPPASTAGTRGSRSWAGRTRSARSATGSRARARPGRRPGCPTRTWSSIPCAALTVAEGRSAGERLAGTAEAEPADRGVLRQRPGGARPAPADDQHRLPGARGPRRSWGTTTSSSPRPPPCR